VVFARQAAFGRPGQPVTFVFSGPYRSIDHPTFAGSACLNRPVWNAWRRLFDLDTPKPPVPGGLRHPPLQLIFSASSVMHCLDVWH
jgi:hypothetical protein